MYTETVRDVKQQSVFNFEYIVGIDTKNSETGERAANQTDSNTLQRTISGSSLDKLFLVKTENCQEKYEMILTSTFTNEFIDDGCKSDGQTLYEMIVVEYGDFIASNLLNTIYMKNTHILKVIKSILYLMAGFTDDRFFDVQSAVLSFALHNDSIETKDLALQCYERWGEKKYIGFLNSLNLGKNYLSEYRDEIVKYLEGR